MQKLYNINLTELDTTKTKISLYIIHLFVENISQVMIFPQHTYIIHLFEENFPQVMILSFLSLVSYI